ncbi:hypothetical protein [Ekhidna sp.]|uniref:hypothetical protein n=1 Tax=Ekhidna sp. TaxID=2608089 RepID=UPI003B505E10
MGKRHYFSAIILIISMQTTYSQNEALIGKWVMVEVIQNSEDVTADHNPENDRFIVFYENNTFESGGTPYGKNTGKYYYDLSKNRLMLDSDAGADDDSAWKLNIEGDNMEWTGIGSEWAERFKILHTKVTK